MNGRYSTGTNHNITAAAMPIRVVALVHREYHLPPNRPDAMIFTLLCLG
jgi:hypothetical protein